MDRRLYQSWIATLDQEISKIVRTRGYLIPQFENWEENTSLCKAMSFTPYVRQSIDNDSTISSVSSCDYKTERDAAMYRDFVSFPSERRRRTPRMLISLRYSSKSGLVLAPPVRLSLLITTPFEMRHCLGVHLS